MITQLNIPGHFSRWNTLLWE